MYKVKNMTYQPVRLVFNTKSVRLAKRDTIIVDELSEQMINLNKKNIIRVKETK